jgi:hypothetical protein
MQQHRRQPHQEGIKFLYHGIRQEMQLETTLHERLVKLKVQWCEHVQCMNGNMIPLSVSEMKVTNK